MAKSKIEKHISLNKLELRSLDQEEGKMILEGYPVVFEKETVIGGRACGWDDDGYVEVIDRNAFEGADMKDVCLRYNHSDGFTILARTRNGSLTLTPDEKGLFMHAELIDTTTNRDIYKMVQAELLKEGSFAFTVEAQEVSRLETKQPHVRITKIRKLFDVSICDNGAYGENTEIYARSLEQAEALLMQAEAQEAARLNVMRKRNENKLKLLRR